MSQADIELGYIGALVGQGHHESTLEAVGRHIAQLREDLAEQERFTAMYREIAERHARETLCKCGHLHTTAEQDGATSIFHRCRALGCECRTFAASPSPGSAPS